MKNPTAPPASSNTYWRFVEQTAKEADRLPQWMKGGTSERRPSPSKPSPPPAPKK